MSSSIKHTTPAILIALAFTLVGASSAMVDFPGSPAVETDAATLLPGTLWSDVLAVAGIDGELGVDPFALEGLAARGGVTSVTSPSSVVDAGRTLLAGLQAADTPSAVFGVATGIMTDPVHGVAPEPSESLPLLVLTMYRQAGIPVDIATVVNVFMATAGLDPQTARGLSVLVAGIIAAHGAARSGDDAQVAQAAADLLAGIEEAEVLFMNSGTSSSISCAPVFEDPEGFIIVGSACDDTYTKHRVLQVDLGGDDMYLNNAGGATLRTFSNVVDPRVDFTLPTAALFNAIFPLSLSPLTDGLFNNESLDQMVLNGTWQDETVASLPGRVTGTLENNSRILTAPEIMEQWLADCQARCGVTLNENLTSARENFPVAVSIDLGAGDDMYQNTNSQGRGVQGAGTGGAIGILWDAGGHDTYTADFRAQGFGGGGGVGILIDRAGHDAYTAGTMSQASTDGGFLFDLGGNDHYVAGTGSQGGRSIPFPTGLYPSVLFDATGDDEYVGNGMVQGAGNFLIDGSGSDSYTAAGSAAPTLTSGYAQGVGFVFSPGMLIDGSGDDMYNADTYAAQAIAVGGGFGALLDFGGNDQYSASGLGQSVCRTQGGPGSILFDGGGDDTYVAAAGQASSQGPCLAALIDAGTGDDSYTGGPRSQGNAARTVTFLTPGIGLLLDAGGDDTYLAGAFSQGSGSGGGTGLLIDADGKDSYTAGDFSQGAGVGGLGVLIDGLQGLVGVDTSSSSDIGDGSASLDASGVATVPGDDGHGDIHAAGDHSQGAGAAGGIGLLIDNDDETRKNGTPHRSLYAAGDHSQGGAVSGGIGVLVNHEGRDDYVAGIGSQGSAIDGTLGVLLDLQGNDRYTVADDTVSRGYGASTLDHMSLGLLVDAEGADHYSGFPGASHNDVCEAKGDAGLTMDVSAGTLPSGCDAAFLAAGTAFLAALVAFAEDKLTAQPGPAGPCTGTIDEYFCDDVESGPGGWTVADGTNSWRIVDAATTPQPNGHNAHSGDHFWYVGAPGAPGATYVGLDGGSTLTSQAIDLTGATAPQLTVSIAGRSESGFDFLRVGVQNATGVEILQSFSGSRAYDPPVVLDLSDYAGQIVNLVFRFTSDEIVEDGPGWNVDDIRVAEA